MVVMRGGSTVTASRTALDISSDDDVNTRRCSRGLSCASTSDPHTPARKRPLLQEDSLASTPSRSPGPGVQARRPWRHLRRSSQTGLSVIEPLKPSQDDSDDEDGETGLGDEMRAANRADQKPAPGAGTGELASGTVDFEAEDNHGKYRRLEQKNSNESQDGEAALARILCGFAEDYFSAPNTGKLVRAAVLKASQTSSEVSPWATRRPDTPDIVSFSRWLHILQSGFSLAVEGVGSKRQLLEAFAERSLKPLGFAIVRMDAFSSRFSTADCLRGILDRVHPAAPTTRSSSVDVLVEALCQARQAAIASAAALRPLCLVVHSLDALPPLHQAALATLAANAPRLHVVASLDSLWAQLAWTGRTRLDFNFCSVQAHTHEEYSTEIAVRFASGLPGWVDPTADKGKGKKASLGLVLRSLTNNHRELVQAIAEKQVELGGRTGISKSALLQIATDRMIAVHATKLRSLLNELKDHEVVVERQGPDGGILYQLPCDDRTMRRLADGAPLEASDEEAGSDGGIDE